MTEQPTEDRVSVPRWWLARVSDCLQGDLPSGRIGDAVFLLREQISDLLSAAPLPHDEGQVIEAYERCATVADRYYAETGQEAAIKIAAAIRALKSQGGAG